MKLNFIKYDGSIESINLIQGLIDKVNEKYKGKYVYYLYKQKPTQNLTISSINTKDIDEGEPLKLEFNLQLGYYVYFHIPEDTTCYDRKFPSLRTCSESHYLEYIKEMTI